MICNIVFVFHMYLVFCIIYTIYSSCIVYYCHLLISKNNITLIVFCIVVNMYLPT